MLAPSRFQPCSDRQAGPGLWQRMTPRTRLRYLTLKLRALCWVLRRLRAGAFLGPRGGELAAKNKHSCHCENDYCWQHIRHEGILRRFRWQAGNITAVRHRQGVHHDTSSRQERILHRRQAAIPPGHLAAPLGPSFVTIPKGEYRD